MNEMTIEREVLEQVVAEACRRAHADVLEFTVAPRITGASGHEWLIEFVDPPRAPELFPRALDEALVRRHEGYRVARFIEGAMAAPRVIELPAGTFQRLGRRVPAWSDDRDVAETVLGVAALGPVPLLAVGA
jgi:hypothetical protein